ITSQIKPLSLTKCVNHLFVDDFYDLLSRVECLSYLSPNRTLSHAGNEILDYCVVDVRFQQCQAHLTHGDVNIRLRELSSAAELCKYTIESVGQVFKHGA